jgi:lysyl-tRNA synthetase class 1
VCAWNWITEYAPEEFKFSLRAAGTKAELSGAPLDAVRGIFTTVLPAMDALSEKELSEAVYAEAQKANIEPKELFTAVYQALIAKDQGPRLAGFMKIIGRERLTELLGAY